MDKVQKPEIPWIEQLFSVQSMQRCYKQDNSRVWLVIRQSPAGKNVSAKAEDIVGIRRQSTTGEDTTDWERLMHTVMNSRVC
jgi:hypothetical protein